MPKLSYPPLTRFDAIVALVDLYLQDPAFKSALEKVRIEYRLTLRSLSADITEFRSVAPRMRRPSTLDGYHFVLDRQDLAVRSYLNELRALFAKWKLPIPEPPYVVIYKEIESMPLTGVLPEYDLYQLLPKKGVITEGGMLPDSVSSNKIPHPVPPLRVTVTFWALVLAGREKALEHIGRRLDEYEQRVKDKGYKEYPSKLKKHAWWWFEHFIHGSKFEDISGLESQAIEKSPLKSGGKVPCAPYGKNIGTAVGRFSKLIGVNPEDTVPPW